MRAHATEQEGEQHGQQLGFFWRAVVGIAGGGHTARDSAAHSTPNINRGAAKMAALERVLKTHQQLEEEAVGSVDARNAAERLRQERQDH